MTNTIPFILCVDDDQLNLELLEAYLEDDYELLLVTDGQQCLDAVKQRAPDIILLDVMMPVMDGKEACKRLKSSPDTQDIPVIMLTGRSFPGDIEEMRDLGADEVLTKPFDVAQLMAAISKHTS